MNTKEFKVKYKDEGNGTLEGYASTWIRVPDSAGDVVKEGAFKSSLEKRWNGGSGIPLLWAHQMDNLSSYIGTANAEEDEKGLHFIASFDDTEEAQRVRELYKDGRLSRFSFAYDILNQAPVELEGGVKANELRELDLHEISCVCVPANDDARVVDVKAGRRNSKSDAEILKQIRSLVDQLLEDEVEDTNDEGKDDAKANGSAPEEQKQSNPEIEELMKRTNEILRRNQK